MMNRLMKRATAIMAIISALIATMCPVHAQQAYTHQIELDASPGYTLHTSPYFSGSNPLNHKFGAMIQGSLRWSMMLTPGTGAYKLWPGLRMGVGLKAFSFLKPSLTGSPAGIFVFQGADIARPSKRLSLAYEWQFGATAPWQIMEQAHPDQNVNGSPVCALLGASLLLRYDLTPEWSMSAGVDLAHYSNGNTRWPNAGTNTAGVRIGVARRLGTTGKERAMTEADTAAITTLSGRSRWNIDILGYGSWHKKCYHDSEDKPLPYPGCFGVAGLNIATSYCLSRRFSAGPSMDLLFDESAVPKSYVIGADTGWQPYFIRPPFVRQTALGLAAQAEYAMPVFSLQVSCGYNVLAGCDDLRYFYQTLSLRTFVSRRIWVNVGYSLRDFAHPRHLMLGIGFRPGGRGHAFPLFK